jgi:hypothetical protein
MILNSLLPVFILITLGYLLKRYKLTNEIFLKTSDKLVYFIFFPAMLFWKIGSTSSDIAIDWGLVKAVVYAVFAIYMLSSMYITFFNVSDYEAGTFSQSCYRFNTYIGIAILINALGEQGVRQFGILIGFIIPLINILAVSTLIWFSGQQFTFWERGRVTVKALVSNPLILACIAGIVYSKTINSFPIFVENSFQLCTSVTLPLALFSIGGTLSTLTLTNLKGYFRLSLVSSMFKLLIFPTIGYCFLNLFQVTDISFKTGMIFFTLPTSTAIYVLSSQLNSDVELASASIMLSTILSFFALSVVLWSFNF